MSTRVQVVRDVRATHRSRTIAVALVALGSVMIWFNPKQYPGWVSACALIALAGVGALLAARGWARRLIAALVLLAGLGLMIGGSWLTVLSGLLIVAGAGIALVRGPSWPSLSSRYDRKPPPGNTDLWKALDRGEDPTDT